ncbi:OLC1v1001624C1 [Oldenlandia corymbosa var. corymbosa]|uniref:OLC1v1001624C1 n=1 Tax=Oldenlandia corymbosa var. corymbosa TaxID=529605 RepID=A0AAV1D6F0_OLDCO|nr:OLC1v1001624C1 [Oldenlandia corymbosa var. corymbosa]
MKDLSLFLLKNYLGSKMRKGFKHFCNGPDSTSTLNQTHHQGMISGQAAAASSSLASVYSPFNLDIGERQPTLEEMILQLEMEEAASRRAKFLHDEENYGGEMEIRHRMSCVNSSDILRSARSALNQYPRFSLDGKDAMYRSSFRNNMSPVGGRNSGRGGIYGKGSDYGGHKFRGLPAVVAGERVVWCSPGVVAKLMGLEAIPIPVQKYSNGTSRRDHHLLGLNLRNPAGRTLHDDDGMTEKARLGFDRNDCRGGRMKAGGVAGASGSCSSSRVQGYSYMKPLRVDDHDFELRNEELGWRVRRFRLDDAP